MQHNSSGSSSFNQPKLGVMMIFGLFRKKNANQRIVERQYAHLTAGARQPLVLRLHIVDPSMPASYTGVTVDYHNVEGRFRASGGGSGDLSRLCRR